MGLGVVAEYVDDPRHLRADEWWGYAQGEGIPVLDRISDQRPSARSEWICLSLRQSFVPSHKELVTFMLSGHFQLTIQSPIMVEIQL